MTVLLVLFLVVATIMDLLERWIDPMFSCLIMGVMIAGSLTVDGWSWSWVGMMVAAWLMWFGRAPGGDQLGAAVIGGALGFPDLLIPMSVAMVGGTFVWAAYNRNVIPYPGRWPFFPFLSVPTAAIMWFSV